MLTQRKIGLVIVGDEILSGQRQDKHIPRVIQMLSDRGMQLSWVQIIGDGFDDLVALYRRTFASGDVVLSAGGIGATPDDRTRQAAAAALDLPLALHPEAEVLIAAHVAARTGQDHADVDMTLPENQRRLAMGYFPEGAQIVPNAFNRVPGFFIQDHTFAPGFPEMAWSMFEWSLDHHYRHLQNNPTHIQSMTLYGVPESRITGCMEAVEARWSGVTTYSLPSIGGPHRETFIELGVKGKDAEQVAQAFELLKAQALAVGGRLTP